MYTYKFPRTQQTHTQTPMVSGRAQVLYIAIDDDITTHNSLQWLWFPIEVYRRSYIVQQARERENSVANGLASRWLARFVIITCGSSL